MKLSDILRKSYKDPYKKQVLIYKYGELTDEYSSFNILEKQDIILDGGFIYNALRNQLIIHITDETEIETKNYNY